MLNGSLRGHAALSDEVEDFVTYWAVPLFVLATFGLWLLDRPRVSTRWRVACLSGLTAAGLGLLVGQLVTSVWDRPRPFVAHPTETLLLVAPSNEPSFPSDHAIAAFAIAFSVLFAGRRLGIAFVAGASAVAVSRVFVGLHYPGDIVGGALIAFLSATLVHRLGGRRFIPIVHVLGRITDPLLLPVWRVLDGLRRRRNPLRR